MPNVSAHYRQQLSTIVESNVDQLLGVCRHYLLRADLATPDTAGQVALELLNDVVVEALGHAERFDGVQEPVAWLIGIAANLIKRRRDEQIKQARREPLIHELVFAEDETLSDAELFDRLADLAQRTPNYDIDADAQVDWLLGHVSTEDGNILRLAIVHELNGQELALALKISPGAARVRLHRALNRLRTALESVGSEELR